VDYPVGVQVNNPEASPSRKPDNANVVFGQDYYYKFGTAAKWDSGPTGDQKMPFTPSQQRYEAMKKYRDRVLRGVDLMVQIKDAVAKGDASAILDASAPEYSIRPMGLLANQFLASENTGTTNELLLARWYINEMYLLIGDVKTSLEAKDPKSAEASYQSLIKAVNSFLGLLNRVVTDKVGDKFQLA